MTRFLEWLHARATAHGVVVNIGDEFAVGSFEEIAGFYADVIVNCTGGWATHLAPDRHLFGLQGVVVHVDRSLVPDRLVFVERGRFEPKPAYIIPHSDVAVLGGTITEVTSDGEQWPLDKQLWTPDAGTILEIVKRCALLEPTLQPLAENLEGNGEKWAEVRRICRIASQTQAAGAAH